MTELAALALLGAAFLLVGWLLDAHTRRGTR